MKNILVPIDLSNVTGRVVEHATTIANAFGAHLWLLHVAQPHPDFTGMVLADQMQWKRIEVQPHHQPFVDIALGLDQKGHAVTPLLLQGPVVESIHETAHSVAADMIVVGSHGHGALYDLLVGSVSEAVIRHAKIPVSVVPAIL